MSLHIAYQKLVYQSEFSIQECIQQIMCLPWEYKGEYAGIMWYECESVSEKQMRIIFKGGQYRRSVHTQYLATFIDDQGKTIIEMKFIEDHFGISVPMTFMEDIDRFMKQKIKAIRCGGENISEVPKRKYTHLDIFKDIGKYIKRKF